LGACEVLLRGVDQFAIEEALSESPRESHAASLKKI
jgi:hypothetical protein